MDTKTKSTTIRFSDKVLNMIHHEAQLEGETSTEFMRNAVLDKLEDSLDYRDAIRNMRSSKETVSRDKVMKDLGLK